MFIRGETLIAAIKTNKFAAQYRPGFDPRGANDRDITTNIFSLTCHNANIELHSFQFPNLRSFYCFGGYSILRGRFPRLEIWHQYITDPSSESFEGVPLAVCSFNVPAITSIQLYRNPISGFHGTFESLVFLECRGSRSGLGLNGVSFPLLRHLDCSGSDVRLQGIFRNVRTLYAKEISCPVIASSNFPSLIELRTTASVLEGNFDKLQTLDCCYSRPRLVKGGFPELVTISRYVDLDNLPYLPSLKKIVGSTGYENYIRRYQAIFSVRHTELLREMYKNRNNLCSTLVLDVVNLVVAYL